MRVGVCLRSLRSPISWSPDPSRIITPLHDVAAATIALPPSISLAPTLGRGARLWIRSLFLFMHFPPLEMPLTPVLIFKSHPPAFPQPWKCMQQMHFRYLSSMAKQSAGLSALLLHCVPDMRMTSSERLCGQRCERATAEADVECE